MIVTRPPDSTQPTDSAPPNRPRATRRPSAAVIALVCVIITGAFAFSAESWIGLAEVTGFRASADTGRVELRLSWVLPIAVDGYLCLTTWLFLSARLGSALRRYSGWSVLVVVALSVLAQGVYHGLDARGVNVAEVWPLVVAVGGLPPALLASSVHLLSIYLHHQGDSSTARSRARRPAASPMPAPRRVEPPTDPSQRLSLVPARPMRQSGNGEVRIDDADLAEAIRSYVLAQRRLGEQPAQRAMQRLVRERTGAKVGQRRCVRIADTITGDDSADDDQESEAAA